MKHQLSIRTTNELNEKYSENSYIHIECNQWICVENQLSGFYYKITLTGNEFSITNHEICGFSNSFQHIKNHWPNTFLTTSSERGFEEMFLAESQSQLWCII